MRFYPFLGVCISISLACGACRKEPSELAHSHSHHHEGHDHDHHVHEAHDHHEHEHHDHDDTHGHEAEPEGVITLDPHVAQRFGLATAKAQRRLMASGVNASATVAVSDLATSIVTAPVAGVVTLSPGISVGAEVSRGASVASVKAGVITGGDPQRMAKVDLDASKAEFDRVAALYADRLVTLAEYNAARAALNRASAAYSAPAASGRASAPAPGIITALNVRSGEAVEAGQTLAVISSGNDLILTALMPAADFARLGMPSDARVSLPYASRVFLVSEQGGRPVASNAAAAAAGGYVPVSFRIPATSGVLPGSAVDVFLIGSSGRDALAVPDKALVEQQGSFSVYVRLDDDCYLQKPLTLGSSDGLFTEVLSGLDEGDDVVVDGVTAVRLASMSGNVPEGHSHSH